MAKAARLQSVGPSTAQPPGCHPASHQPCVQGQVTQQIADGFQAFPGAPGVHRHQNARQRASTLAPDKSERSVRRSTCRTDAVSIVLSLRVRVIDPARQNRASKWRGSNRRGKETGSSCRENKQAGRRASPVPSPPGPPEIPQHSSASSPCLAAYPPNSPFFSQGSFRISPTSYRWRKWPCAGILVQFRLRDHRGLLFAPG